jgi:hypothetical protein
VAEIIKMTLGLMPEEDAKLEIKGSNHNRHPHHRDRVGRYMGSLNEPIALIKPVTCA